MTITDVEICSVALVKLGAKELSSFDDETVEADVARRLYEVTLRGLIASHPWHFSMAEAELETVDEAPIAGFSNVFALPPDLLRIISAGAGGRARGLDYRLTGGRLHASSSRAFLRYQHRAETVVFPAFFVQALTAKLAAEFCLPLTESTSRADALYKLAAAEHKVARLIDSQQATPRAVEDFTLIAARSQ
jgi:hypothetical protein